MNAGRGGEVFSRDGRGPVENSFLETLVKTRLTIGNLIGHPEVTAGIIHYYPWHHPDSRARGASGERNSLP